MQQLNSKIRFLLVGATAFIIDASSYLLATEIIGITPFYARLIAFLVAVSVTCYGNRTFTFSERAHQGFAKQYGLAVLAALVSLIPNMALFLGILSILPSSIISTLFAFSCGTAIGIVFNYALSDRFVFAVKMAKQ